MTLMETNSNRVWVIARGEEYCSSNVMAVTSDLPVEEIESIAREVINEHYPNIQKVTLNTQYSMGDGKALRFMIIFNPQVTTETTYIWTFPMTMLK